MIPLWKSPIKLPVELPVELAVGSAAAWHGPHLGSPLGPLHLGPTRCYK